MSAHERHNRRDEILSAKHRRWGYNVPAVDVDFLLVEYDQAKAKALIEYRHANGHVIRDASIQAITDLADRAALPFFIVRYYYATDDGTLWKEASIDTPAWFQITTCNEHAEKLWFTQDVDTWMTEQEYAVWLHKIRGRHN
jgi:hypothetical protein